MIGTNYGWYRWGKHIGGMYCNVKSTVRDFESIFPNPASFSAVFLPPLFVNCAHVPLRENSPDSVSVWHGFYGLCRFAVHFVSHHFFFSVVTLNGLAVWSRICAGGRSCFKDSLRSLQTRLVCPSCVVLKLYQKMLTWQPKSVSGPKSKGF